MLRRVLLALLLAAVGELTASPRTPALLLALTDKAAAPLLQNAFTIALRERTDLDLALAKDPKCETRERFACWVRASEPKASYLFVISAQGDRAQVMMIDLSSARAALASGGGGEEAENRIFEEATTMASGLITLDDPAALERWAIDLLERDLKSKLDRAHHWAIFGDILLHAPRPGLSISFNGTRIGFTAEGATRIRDVQIGTHVIALEELRETKSVLVAAASTAEVRFDPPPPTSTVRETMLWTGGAIAATGVVIEVVAIAMQPSEFLRLCRGIECELRAPDRFERVGPFLAAPLGYALAGAGATWAGGAWFAEDHEDPWIALIAGGAIGALAYGLSAALEGSR